MQSVAARIYASVQTKFLHATSNLNFTVNLSQLQQDQVSPSSSKKDSQVSLGTSSSSKSLFDDDFAEASFTGDHFIPSAETTAASLATSSSAVSDPFVAKTVLPPVTDLFITSFTRSQQSLQKTSHGSPAQPSELALQEEPTKELFKSQSPFLDMESPPLEFDGQRDESDPFSSLCPIGSKKDRKEFFADQKTPQKKSLRELRGETGGLYSMSVDSSLLQHLVKPEVQVVSNADPFSASYPFQVPDPSRPPGEGKPITEPANLFPSPTSDPFVQAVQPDSSATNYATSAPPSGQVPAALFPSPTSDPFEAAAAGDADPFSVAPPAGAHKQMDAVSRVGVVEFEETGSSAKTIPPVKTVPLASITQMPDDPFDTSFTGKVFGTDSEQFTSSPAKPQILHVLPPAEVASDGSAIADVPTPTDDPFVISSRLRKLSGEPQKSVFSTDTVIDVFSVSENGQKHVTSIGAESTSTAPTPIPRARPKGKPIDSNSLTLISPPSTPQKNKHVIGQLSSESTDSVPSPDMPPPPLPSSLLDNAPMPPPRPCRDEKSPSPPPFAPPPLLLNTGASVPTSNLRALSTPSSVMLPGVNPVAKPRRLLQKAQTVDTADLSSAYVQHNGR